MHICPVEVYMAINVLWMASFMLPFKRSILRF